MLLKHVESLNILWCTNFLNAKNMLKVPRKKKKGGRRMKKA
jgi:hypothetical protein